MLRMLAGRFLDHAYTLALLALLAYWWWDGKWEPYFPGLLLAKLSDHRTCFWDMVREARQ